MRVLVISSLLAVAISASFLGEEEVKFQSFKLKHSKTYNNQDEELKRFNIFKDNLRDIEEHNALYEQGRVSYKKGINKFTDMTDDEFKAMLTLKASPEKTLHTTPYVKLEYETPTSIDWREKGQVTKVKDQGGCGSCWAFSVTGSVEAAYYRKFGKLVTLSEQQLVDCSIGINHGCLGGFIDRTLRYLTQEAVQSESSYPYEGFDLRCRSNASSVITKITNFTSIDQGDEDALFDAVANLGPVAVAIDASFLKSYHSGVYKDYRCNPYELNHGVLIVGYGNERNPHQDYWIVKNSWDETWGEEGYFRIARWRNECGIAETALFPVID